MGDAHEGPYSLDDVFSKLDQGQVSLSDFAWTAGMPDWELIEKVPAFGANPAPASDTQRIDPRSVGITPMNDVPGLPGILVNGFLGYGYTGNDYADEQNNFQFADTLTWVRGAHSMKFGAEYRPDPAA